MNTKMLKGKRLLIVEDNEDNAFCLKIALKPFEMNISNAINGHEAISMLNDEPFDIILMDIRLPGLNGYEIIKKIRTFPKTTSIPIISVTACAMPEDRQKSLEAGANEYIPKPIQRDELVAKMAMLL